MRWRTRALSTISTGDSDISSCWEIKHRPAFESLQANQALPRVSGWCPFHLRHQIQGPSQILIAERSVLLRFLWKVCIPLELKPGNQLSSQDDLWYMVLFLSCCAELGIPLDLGQCSWGISVVGLRKSSHLSCLIGNAGWLWSQCSEIGLYLNFICSSWSSFVLLL